MDWFKGWFDFNTDLTLSNVDKLLKLVNPIYAVGSNAVSKLKESAREWYQSFQELKKIPDGELSRELLIEKKNLETRGNSIMGKIQALGIGADTLQGQMGAIPLLAVGVIGTAAGLMLYWTYDFIKFKDKLAVYRAARKSGESVSSATGIMNSLNTRSGLFSGFTNFLKYGVILGGGYAAYKIAKSQKWI
jgi:hypothetical protein